MLDPTIDRDAHEQGQQAAIKYDSDPSKVENPYKPESRQWLSWNFGWGTYWNPKWDKESQPCALT